MVTEKTEEVTNSEVNTEFVAQPEEKESYTKEEVAAIKAEQAKMKDEYEKQLKTERNTITRHTARLKQLEEKGQLTQAQSQELTGLRDSVTGLEDMIATLVDMQAGVTEQTQQYSAKRILEEKRKAQKGNGQPGIDPQAQADALALQRLAVKLGVDGKNLRMAQLTYQDEGFDAAWDFMNELGKEPKEDQKEEPKKEETKEFPKPPEGSGQSVKHFTRERIANMSPEEYTRHRNEIQEAIDQGRIK